MKKIIALVFILGLLSCKDESKKNDIIDTKTGNEKVVVPEALQKIINEAKKDTDNVDLQLKISSSFDSLSLFRESLQYLDKVITTDSLNQDYWLRRGRLCNKLKDTASAIKAFGYAAKIYPSAESLLELADVLSMTKNSKAINVCDEVMKMNPGHNYDDKAYFFKGIYFSKINDKKNALQFFDKCIGTNFHFAEAYIEKGWLYFDDKKYNDALTIFKQLTDVNPANADGYYWQAKCFEAMNKKQEAIDLYNKSLQLDETISEAKVAVERLKNKA